MSCVYRDMQHRLLTNSVQDFESPLYLGEPCWVWIGERTAKGYGRLTIRVNGRPSAHWAHRVAWSVFKGEVIPRGMEIDHGCVNSPCINPWHFDLVPKVVNLSRRDARRAMTF